MSAELPSGERFSEVDSVDNSKEVLDCVMAEGQYLGRVNKKHTFKLNPEDSEISVEVRAAKEPYSGMQPASMIRFRSNDIVATFVFHEPRGGDKTVLEISAPDRPKLRPITTLSSSRQEDGAKITEIWQDQLASSGIRL